MGVGMPIRKITVQWTSRNWAVSLDGVLQGRFPYKRDAVAHARTLRDAANNDGCRAIVQIIGMDGLAQPLRR